MRRRNILYSLVSEVIRTLWLPQYSTGHTSQLWLHRRGDYRRVWIPGRKDPWGPCWWFVTSVLLLFLWQLADYFLPMTMFQWPLWPSRVRKSQNYHKTTESQSILSWQYECQQLKVGELRFLGTAGEGALSTLFRVGGPKQQQWGKDGFQKMESSERKKVNVKKRAGHREHGNYKRGKEHDENGGTGKGVWERESKHKRIWSKGIKSPKTEALTVSL